MFGKLRIWHDSLLRIEHSKTAYIVDFIVYFLSIIGLIAYFLVTANIHHINLLIALVIFGFASWTLVEYVLHRWVLHNIAPFSNWHWEHHKRPSALICTATIVSASAILLTIYLPLRLIASAQVSNAYMLGLLIGYFIYAVTHHAIHHWESSSQWLTSRKVMHRMHHTVNPNTNFGVTFGIWDFLLKTSFKQKSRI